MKKKLRNGLEYFWMYHKLTVMTAAIILSLGIYFLSVSLSQKETVLSVMLLDCHTEVSQKEMEEDILTALGVERNRYQAEVQNSLMISDTSSGNYAMTSLSRFLADIGSEKLDVCAMLEEDFRKYEKADTYLDLRECFTDEELACVKDALVVMEDGRAVGLYADALPGLGGRYGCYEGGDSRGIIGVVYNTQHRKAAAAYLRYLADCTEV